MNVYHSHGFRRNLPDTKYFQPMSTTPNMAHDANDHLYWKLWVITDAQPKLAKLVDANQLTDFLREIMPLTPHQQYLKIARQIELEEAHQLADSTCTCHELDPIKCPVCQAMADGLEIEF